MESLGLAKHTRDLEVQAFTLLSRGLIPIVIEPETKKPLFAGWVSTTRETALSKVRSAVELYSDKPLNLGVLCGKVAGITVVDIDVGRCGMEKWAELVDRYGKIDTYTVRTGSGGLHLYFRYESSVPTQVGVGHFGIDIRNDKAMVLAEGSSHPKTGQPYTLLSATRDINPMPEWVVAFLRSPWGS